MDESQKIIVFTLDRQRYGIALAAVDRVVRLVEITPLPGAPSFVRGVINIQGTIVPVVDLRLRFGLPARPIELSDQLLIVRSTERSLALTADTAEGVCDCRQEAVTAADAILPDLPLLSGIARLPDGLILIHDLEQLLSPQESQVLSEAVTRELA